MTEKKQGREIAFIETYEEEVKKTIERAFLTHNVSYLIKVEKMANRKKEHLGSKMKYTFQINKYQQDEAKTAIEEKDLEEDSFKFLF